MFPEVGRIARKDHVAANAASFGGLERQQVRPGRSRRYEVSYVQVGEGVRQSRADFWNVTEREPRASTTGLVDQPTSESDDKSRAAIFPPNWT